MELLLRPSRPSLGRSLLSNLADEVSAPVDEDKPSFDEWLRFVTPLYTWDVAHLIKIREYLAEITAGDNDRLMVFCPPRHGKSAMTTVRYPIWRMEREPTLRVIVACYNQILANRFSRAARRIAISRLELDRERKAVEEWQTTAGGVFRAVGVGGGITGQGGDLIVIDDPVQSREQAESESYRERVWEWYTDDLFTRLEPGAAIILIQTRWHEDDLAGRILASEDAAAWKVVNLPALAEKGDLLLRTLGDPLWPERFGLEALAERRRVLGTYSFTALYQQRPQPIEGGMFKREWFDIINVAPAQALRVRYWDKSASEGEGDYSAGVKIAKDSDGQFYIEDVLRGQWSPLTRERLIKQTAILDGKGTTVWVEQEPGSGGKESAQNTVRNLAGYKAYMDRVTGEKAVRAMPFSAQCEARNVKLVRGAWNAAYLDEICNFPYGAHDDQVDGSSGGFAKLAAMSTKRVVRSQSFRTG